MSSAAAASAAAGQAGYLHPRYAASLSEFGRPMLLPRSGAWLLLRTISGSAMRDALAGYPHLFCRDWSSLAADLEECRGLVAITAVTDPCARLEIDCLKASFPDLVRPYKQNYVIDLKQPTPSSHHRAKIRKALRAVDVIVPADPLGWLDAWEDLYEELRRRHRITGMRAFSRTAFRDQFGAQGCVLFCALAGGVPVAMMMWYAMGDVAHYHVGASNAVGYRCSASYALTQTAIDVFAGARVRWLNLGAAAGKEADDRDGLSRFKMGWTNCSRPSYLCGRVVDPAEYARLSAAASAATPPAYFPAYRAGEHE